MSGPEDELADRENERLETDLAVARGRQLDRASRLLVVSNRQRKAHLERACILARKLAVARDALLEINEWATLTDGDPAPGWIADLTDRVLRETEVAAPTPAAEREGEGGE